MAIVYAIFTLNEPLEITPDSIRAHVGCIPQWTGSPLDYTYSYTPIEMIGAKGFIVRVEDARLHDNYMNVIMYDVVNTQAWFNEHQDQLSACFSEAIVRVPVAGTAEDIHHEMMSRGGDTTPGAPAALVYGYPYDQHLFINQWAGATRSNLKSI